MMTRLKVGWACSKTILVSESLEGEPAFDLKLRAIADPSADPIPREEMSLNFAKVGGDRGDRWLQTLRWPDGRRLTFVVMAGRPPCDEEQRG